MLSPFVFVNYDNPSQTKDRAKRQIISTHIGRYYRNRSGPSQRKESHIKSIRTREHEADHFSVESPSRARPHGIAFYRNTVGRGSRNSFLEQHIPRPHKEALRPTTPTHDLGSLMPLLDYYLEQQQIRESEQGGEKTKDPPSRPFWTSHPMSLVGQGRVDPFATFAVDEDYTQIHLGIDYGVQRFWPMVAPNRRSTTVDPSAKGFLIQMKTSSLSYYSYLIAIVTNFEWMHGENPKTEHHERLRLRNGLALFRYVREAIETLNGPPSNALLGAVVALGSNFPERVPSRMFCTPSRFHSPMADAQILDQYGAFIFPATHWRALIQLVRLSGGINRIESKDIAGCCQLGDLLEASKKSSLPDLEYCTIFGEDSIADSLEDVNTLSAGGNLASSFLDPTLETLQTRGLHRTIRAVTQATLNLDIYLKNGSPNGDQPELLGLRNRAQWLSLNLQRPSFEWINEGPITDGEQSVFDISRIALLIYNNLVLFPLPPVSGVDTRLALRLKAGMKISLEKCPEICKMHPELLLWALVLGGISDSQNLERPWFLEQFKKLLAEEFSEYRKWSQIESCLTSCMWLGAVLNDEAINFWADSRG